MPRIARPWYSSEKRCYMAYIEGRKVRLLDGEKTKTNEKEAAKKLREIQKGRQLTTGSPAGGHTVASIIDLYLKMSRGTYISLVCCRISSLATHWVTIPAVQPAVL